MLTLVLLAWADPKETTLDLWRAYPGADKVYVEATLPDGSTGLFLVDTGASISVMNEGAASRLGLVAVDAGGTVQGLSGSAPWRRATLGTLQLGAFTLDHVDVAVDVPGVPEVAGALPVDGILGSNVWSQFTVVVDYPQDRLELHVPGTWSPRGRSYPLTIDPNHLLVQVDVTAERDGRKIRASVPLEIDTGAQDLSMVLSSGEPFRELTTVGMEHVFGIGADLDRVPDFDFLETTRRIPVTTIRVAGRTIHYDHSVRWSCADEVRDSCLVTPGLVGYSVLADYRVVIDYARGLLTLEKPRGRPRQFDAAGAWLDRDRRVHRDDPARAAVRARVLASAGRAEDAAAVVADGLARLPGDAELTVLRARLHRADGQLAEAAEALGSLPPVDLAEQGEWVGFINTLALQGRAAEAVERAKRALEATVGEPVREEFLVALSDAELAAGRPGQAARALDEAIAVDEGGSAFLFRKARIALAEGDHYGAIVTLRNLMHVYPVEGQSMWLYGLAAQERDRETFRVDLERALSRLHPGTQPWDFAGAAWMAIGEEERGRAALAEGRKRDCGRVEPGPDRSNCEAWYAALGKRDLDEAAALIDGAIAAQPRNSAFQDTAAMVAMARGDAAAAYEHALAAARLSPWDPYLLWQVARMATR
jgi:tetratricopeptide (TPR) repeat protein